MAGAITTAALAAAKAETDGRVSTARAQLVAFFDGKVPANALTLADVNDGAVIITDGEVHLAVNATGVFLVTGKTGDWTFSGPALKTLADLGRKLALAVA